MISKSYKIRLVTFATPQYFHRQLLLGFSARCNRVVDEVSNWSPACLSRHGFTKSVDGISLSERGSGFWSWKPFVISQCLENMMDGDILLYCDVGRVYPFKLLDQPLEPLIRWMEEACQDVMPGIAIPWNGPVIQWTKRDALVLMGMDEEDIRYSSPIQASFSVWRATRESRALANEWRTLCANRQLVSDDPSRFSGGEYPDFKEHRHDQALWTLLCWKRGIRAMKLSSDKPPFDEKNPSEVVRHLAGPRKVPLCMNIIQGAAGIFQRIERCFRPPSGHK
jgi:hypothetical protein